MQRVLDIDLDFFVSPVVHWPQLGTRPTDEEHTVWLIEDALAFLRTRCALDGKLPGFLTENHAELFPLWREALVQGALSAPFHVTHVDAHADLGLGDAGYTYLMSSLLFRPVEERRYPPVGFSGLNDGNYLLYATACRWVGDLEYVYCEGGGGDELPYAVQGFEPGHEPDLHHLQLLAMTEEAIDRIRPDRPLEVSHREPPVSYRSTAWKTFNADGPFDFICLTRSPPFSPQAADPLYDAIRDAFFDPLRTSLGSPLVDKPPPTRHSRIW